VLHPGVEQGHRVADLAHDRHLMGDDDHSDARDVAHLAGGARVWGCDVVLSASAPGEEHLALMSRGAVLICRLDPARHPQLLESPPERGPTPPARTWSETSGRTSEPRTCAPREQAVPMADRPATPPPRT